MNEHAIPTYVMMMAPTLEALDGLGGSSTKDELDAAVIARMGLTAAQLAVEFSDESRRPRSKVAHRLALARTYLKKLGYVTNSPRRVWTLEPPSRAILDLDRDNAAMTLHRLDGEVRRAERSERSARVRGSDPAEGTPLDDELSELLNDAY